MPDIKLYDIEQEDTLIFSGTKRPSRLLKNVKNEWRVRYGGISRRPVQRAKRGHKRHIVVYTAQGTCDSTFRNKIEEFAKRNSDYKFYNPLVTEDSSLCCKHNTRCGPSGNDYGYDRIVITSCETEILAGKLPTFEYQYRITMEEAIKT